MMLFYSDEIQGGLDPWNEGGHHKLGVPGTEK